MVVGVAAVAELADPRMVRTSHLAWQNLAILKLMEKSFETAEWAATRVSLRKRLLWRLETWDLQPGGAELGLDDAETVDVDA